MGEMKVYCERDCTSQKDGFCQNESIAISEDGVCCDYEKIEYHGAEGIGEKTEYMADFILTNSHFCPIPIEMKCVHGFKNNGCRVLN